jgi:hypothetical protein
MSQRNGLAVAISVAVLVGGLLLGQQGTSTPSEADGAPAAMAPTFPPLPSAPPTYPQQTPHPIEGIPAIAPTHPGQIPAFETEAVQA